MIEGRRRRFGAYLARLRHDLGLSQRQLAGRVCRFSGTASVSRHEVSRWERGERLPDTYLFPLAEALRVDVKDLERAASYARGERVPGGTVSPVETLASFLPQTDDHLGPLTTSQGRRVGASAAERLAARAHGLRLADDVISGQDLMAPALRELRGAVRFYRETSHTEQVGKRMLTSIGELAQIAGWIAGDAGEYEYAERAYRLGISAAREAGALPLVGNLAGSLAYQYSNTGREADGLSLARAALEEASPDAPGKTRALYFDRVAWAHAKLGTSESQPAMRALAKAHEALAEEGPRDAPDWAYWVSGEELDIMDARVYTELHKPLRAVPLLQEVLSRYDTAHTRELALYLSWLAVALVDANEPEEAADTARQMLDLTADSASTRTTERARVVLAKLKPFHNVPEVRTVLNAYAA